MTNKTNTTITTTKTKIEYSIASFGDSVCYALPGTFLMFFFTTVAGIKPVTAGTIIVIGTVWDALFSPVMGYISDMIYAGTGKRGTLIMFFLPFLVVSTFLLFTDINISGELKNVYYCFMLIIFWCSYTGFFIPYCALGVDYTSDYDDRTKLRLWASFFNSIGTICAIALPTTIVEALEDNGASTGGAWSATAAVLSLMAGVSIVWTVFASGGKGASLRRERQLKHEQQRSITISLKKIISEYIEIARLKPMRYLILTAAFSLIAQTIITSTAVYYFTYNLSLSSGAISVCLFFRSVAGMACIPLVGRFTRLLDKRETLIGLWVIGIIGFLAVRFLPLPTIAVIVIYVVSMAVTTSTYWQVMPSVFYDVCEYDRIIVNENRSSAILSFQGFVETIAAGIGGQILGWVLQVAQFDGAAAVQSAATLAWLDNAATLIPVIILVAAGIAFYKYPITKTYYDKMINGSAEA